MLHHRACAKTARQRYRARPPDPTRSYPRPRGRKCVYPPEHTARCRRSEPWAARRGTTPHAATASPTGGFSLSATDNCCLPLPYPHGKGGVGTNHAVGETIQDTVASVGNPVMPAGGPGHRGAVSRERADYHPGRTGKGGDSRGPPRSAHTRRNRAKRSYRIQVRVTSTVGVASEHRTSEANPRPPPARHRLPGGTTGRRGGRGAIRHSRPWIITVLSRCPGFVPVFSAYAGPFSCPVMRRQAPQLRSHSRVTLDGTQFLSGEASGSGPGRGRWHGAEHEAPPGGTVGAGLPVARVASPAAVARGGYRRAQRCQDGRPGERSLGGRLTTPQRVVERPLIGGRRVCPSPGAQRAGLG